MIRYVRIAILVALAVLLVRAAHAQTWFTVAPENSSSSLTLPADTTYQIGVDVCPYAGNVPAWSLPVTVAVATTFIPFSMGTAGVFPFGDPCPGTVKILQVLETSAIQNLSLDNTTIGVPALTSAHTVSALVTCPAPATGNPNPTMPSAPPNCAPLANEIAVCADGCTVTDLLVSEPVFFQYCVGTGMARVCAAPFMYDLVPIVVGSNVQCGGPPTANFVSAGTLYAVESDRQTTVDFSASDGTPQPPILVPVLGSPSAPTATPSTGGV